MLNTTILNITYGGLSADYPLDTNVRLTDSDVRRIAVELVRGGSLRALGVTRVPDRAFDEHVVDRFDSRIYLRPKVPFG